MNVEANVETTDNERWARVEDLGREVKDAGRHVWLAGLGAVGTVDERGRSLISGLVERGEKFEAKGRPALEERFRKVSDRVDGFRQRLGDRVEQRVSGTLQRFGVPARDQVQDLIQRIEDLTRQVENLSDKTKA